MLTHSQTHPSSALLNVPSVLDPAQGLGPLGNGQIFRSDPEVAAHFPVTYKQKGQIFVPPFTSTPPHRGGAGAVYPEDFSLGKEGTQCSYTDVPSRAGSM